MCPDDERVAAYVSVGLSDAERDEVEAHLRRCDRCVNIVAIVQQRLSLADEIAAPVPAGVRARVRSVAEVPALRQVSWWAVARDWMTPLLRAPVLIPAVAAAGALMLILTVAPRIFSPRDLTRGLPPVAEKLRVTGHAVPVYERPSSRAAVVASVERGMSLTIRGEDRDWYSVVLPDGKEGWVEREAFE